jgi:sugar phosphate isomerase/epimerase
MARKASGFGYDGVELACWGDHFDVSRALDEADYCRRHRELLEQHELDCFAISTHLVGQAVCDRIDRRHQAILPPHVWGDGDPDGVNQRAAAELKATARAAEKFGVEVVNGFTGSSIWHLIYSFPPVPDAMIEEGFQHFADRWNPILDEFARCGVRFALEVHPTEIAFDIHTARRALEAIDHRPEFGFNFDPSHLHWQGVDPVEFIRAFPDRIFHVHVKDAITTLDGRSGILASHLGFGDPRRGWDFRSPGRGNVNFEEIIRALNVIGYQGPLSVEWEDCGMDREFGATEACEFTRSIDFAPSTVAFDAAFEKA